MKRLNCVNIVLITTQFVSKPVQFIDWSKIVAENNNILHRIIPEQLRYCVYEGQAKVRNNERIL